MSLFSEVIKLRDQFRSRSEANFNFTTALLDDDIAQLTSASKGIVNNNIYYSAQAVDQQINMKFFKSSTDELVLEIPDVSRLGERADVIIDEVEGLSVNDAIANISSSANLYGVLSDITGRFSYLNRQKFTDIATLLNTTVSTQANSLLQSLSHGVDSDGFLSINSFFSIINNFFQANNDNIQDGSPELDVTNPYHCVDLTSIVLDVLQTVFSTLMIVLQGIFRVLAAILSAIMSVFKSAINALNQKTHTVIDYNQGNMFVQGPILAYESRDDADVGVIPGGICNRLPSTLTRQGRNHVWYQENSGIGMFSWLSDFKEDSTSDQTRFNGYMYPCINVEKLGWRHIFSYEAINSNHVKMYMNTTPGQGVQDPDSKYYISLSGDMGDWPLYSEEDQPSTPFFAMFSIMLTWFIRQLRFSKQCVDKGTGTHGVWDFIFHIYTDDITDDVWRPYSNAYQSWIPGMFGLIANILISGPDCDSTTTESVTGWYRVWNTTSASKKELFQNYYVDKLEDLFSKFIRDHVMANNSSPYGEVNLFNGEADWESHGHIHGDYRTDCYPSFTSFIVGSSFITYSGTNYPCLSFNPIKLSDDYVHSDCLPSTFGLVFPSISSSELTTAIITLSLAVAAISIAAIVIKTKITKMNVAKKTLKADKIAKLRQDYLEHPDDPTYKKDYENAVYKYNLFGSLFGYGTYDGRNGWFDSASSSGDSMNQVSLDNILGKAAVTDENVSNVDTKVVTTQGMISTDYDALLRIINQIKNLITSV